MKEIIAIIRPKQVSPTRKALEEHGFPSMTAVAVLGRGLQHGILGEVNVDLTPECIAANTPGKMKYVPKRLLSIVVPDEGVKQVIDTIIAINQTHRIGDGKIFVCPIDDVMRLRSGERGEEAVL